MKAKLSHLRRLDIPKYLYAMGCETTALKVEKLLK